MNKENVQIDVSWIWSLAILVIVILLGVLESGQGIGGVVAFAIALPCLIGCLVGLVPAVGPFIYYFWLSPIIVGTIMSFYPEISMPLTLFIILLLTTALSIVYTIVGMVIVLIVLLS